MLPREFHFENLGKGILQIGDCAAFSELLHQGARQLEIASWQKHRKRVVHFHALCQVIVGHTLGEKDDALVFCRIVHLIGWRVFPWRDTCGKEPSQLSQSSQSCQRRGKTWNVSSDRPRMAGFPEHSATRRKRH